MRRLLLVSLPVLFGLLVGWSLSDGDVEAAPPAVRPRATTVGPRASEPARTAPPEPHRAAAPIVQASPVSPDVEGILERLEDAESRALAPEEALALRGALLDPGADLALRAGALRALADAQGRALLPVLVELYPREDVAPLRPLLAACVARGAGPDDRALLESLVAAGERAGDEAALGAALRAAVLAARRDPEDQPVRLDAALEKRLVRALTAQVRRAEAPQRVRREALEGLAGLATRDALWALEDLEGSAPDPLDRVDAGFLRAMATR